MKNILGILLMAMLALPAIAQLIIYEPFDYVPGTLLRSAGTWRYAGSPAPDARVMAGNLTIPGLLTPQGNLVSNTANVGTADTHCYSNVPYFTMPMALTAYYSFAFTVQSTLHAGVSNLFAIGENDYHVIRLRANANDTNNYDVGVGQKPTVSVVWDANGGNGYPPGPTNFLVMSVDLSVAGANVANALQLWLNPAPTSYGHALPPAPALATTAYISATYLNRVRYVRFYRTQNTTLYFDELRVGTSWADVTPSGSDEIVRPVNHAPADGELVSLTPTLAASAFVSSPSNSHSASEFYLQSLLSGAQWTFTLGPVTNLDVPPGTLTQSSLYRWQVRYLGTFSTSIWSLATTFQTAQTTGGLLIAYDGAAYAETNTVAGLAGGQGWASAWTNLSNQVGVRAGGLAYPGLNVTGATFMTADPAASPLRAVRTIAVGDGMAHLLTPAGKFGRANSTNWLSYLVAAGEDFTNGEYGVELYDGTSRRAYVTKSQDLPRWWLSMPSTNGAGCAFDKFSTNIQWLVIRIVHSASGASNGTAHLWTDPLVSETMPGDADAAIALYAVRPFTFDKLTVFANAWPASGSGIVPTALIDEIRFGEDWLNMMDVPEPAIILGLALMALGGGRRAFCSRG